MLTEPFLPMTAKKLIGFFRYNLFPDELAAYGTYVLKAYRSRGIGAKLWRKALNKVKPAKVTVYTTSDSGERLVFSLMRKFPDYNWYCERLG